MAYYTGVGESPPYSGQTLRKMNRYVFHPQGKRCCSSCQEIKDLNQENFGVHRYYRDEDGNIVSVGYDGACKLCMVRKRALHNTRIKEDYKWYCKKLLSQLKARAKSENLPFNLTAEDLIHEFDAQDGLCRYTGKKLDFTLRCSEKGQPHRDFPSVDRKIPSRGYTLGNVDWVTYAVNRMKNDLTEEEFLDFCRNITKREGM